jgi:HD domain
MAPTTSTKTIAGVTVPDTKLITAALDHLHANVPPVLYNHSVRCWLFGCIIARQIPAFADLDLEAHAIAVLFHDIGLSPSPSISTPDKRFEVDGANAAREFIKTSPFAADWDKHRLQLVWDTIALHSTVSIAKHKEIEVQAAVSGIFTDLTGPVGEFGGLVGKERWEEVVKEFPRLDMKNVAREVLCGVCKTKPETTYDNFLRDYGEKYVEGYSVVGSRVIDALENTPE